MQINQENKVNNEPNLGDLLLLFRRNIRDSIRKGAIKSELTFSEVEVLHFIGIRGEKTMKSISDYLKIKPPSATEIVKSMEKKNLIKRITNGKDKRVVMVRLTEGARRNYISMSKKKEAILDKMTSRLSEDDEKTLKRIIKIITAQ